MTLPKARHHVFVYGTLRPGGYYHRRLVDGEAVIATPAWVRGTLYVLDPGYPGLRPGNARVEGDVLSFEDDALLARLDKLEGFDPRDPASPDSEYTRERCEAFSLEGQPRGEVWAYWILPSRLSQYNGHVVEHWDHLG